MKKFEHPTLHQPRHSNLKWITRLGWVSIDRVVLAAPRGFCAGVEKAIKALDWMTRVFEPPVFCYHEIVHNQFVVDYFKSLGVVFIDDVADVPSGAPVMLSAHGSPPQVIETARQSGGMVIDAVCPLVTKVHHELKVRARKGYTVLYIGHEGHEEAVGTMAVAPESVHLIESTDDIDRLVGKEGPFALLSQTTLSFDEWQHLREYAEQKFPDIWKQIMEAGAGVEGVITEDVNIRAKVVGVDKKLGLVILNAGQKQGVQKGYTFIIYREDQYVGKVLVQDVTTPDTCAARYIKELMRTDPEVGDDAALRLMVQF